MNYYDLWRDQRHAQTGFDPVVDLEQQRRRAIRRPGLPAEAQPASSPPPAAPPGTQPRSPEPGVATPPSSGPVQPGDWQPTTPHPSVRPGAAQPPTGGAVKPGDWGPLTPAPTLGGVGGGFERQTYTIPPPPKPPVVRPPQLGAGGVDFLAIARELGAAREGPRYQTADGSWQGENMRPELESYARDWMANPNRFLSDTVDARRNAFEAEADLFRDRATGGIEEWAASRGLVGSNFEGQELTDMEGQLDANRLKHMADLLEMQAAIEAQDRMAAGQYGLNVGDFGRSLGADRRDEGRYGHEADRARSRDYEDDRRARTDAQFRGGQLSEDSRFREFDAGLESQRFLSDQEYRNAALTEQGNIDRGRLQLEGQDLDLRAHQIQQDAKLRGQELTLQQARDQAAKELGVRDLDIRQKEMEEARRHREWLELMGFYDLLERGGPPNDEDEGDTTPTGPYQSPAPPKSPKEGMTWKNTMNGLTYKYQNGQWVVIG